MIKDVHLKAIVYVKFGYELELDRFPNFPHWLSSPFPPRDIEKITKLGGNTGMLGCSLPAIDALLTPGKKNASFQSIHQNSKDSLKFVPFQGAEEFKMTMPGRKAILPQLMGVVVNKIFKNKYLTSELFIHIEANGGFFPLD